MGGWTLEAAEIVCADEAEGTDPIAQADILEVLTQLVNKSLVLAAAQAGEMRYRLLEQRG
jgi:predicted ATPase